MKKLVFVIALCLPFVLGGCLGSCVDNSRIIHGIEDQGYTDVTIVDKAIVFVSWSGCSSGDDAAYVINATNSLGNSVTLIACAGWPFKGVTIRGAVNE